MDKNEMSDTPSVKKYIDSVDGMAHQSAIEIIAGMAEKKEWVGLTDGEFKTIMLDTYNIDLNVPGHSSDDHLLWAAIEAKLKDKNGG